MANWIRTFTYKFARYHGFHVLFCIFVVVSFCCAWQAVTIKADPRDALAASPSHRRMGMVRQGETVSADFELRNISSSPIEIVEIRHTCTCTSHSIPKMSLDPGEAVQLTMSMDTKYRRDKIGASSFIEYHKRGEEKSRHLDVQMSADIDPDYDVKPAEIAFRKGIAETRQLQLVPRHIVSVNVKMIECDKPCFSARSVVDKAAALGELVSVAYNPKEDCPDNEGGTLTIRTDSSNQPVLCIDLLLKQQHALGKEK